MTDQPTTGEMQKRLEGIEMYLCLPLQEDDINPAAELRYLRGSTLPFLLDTIRTLEKALKECATSPGSARRIVSQILNP